MCAPNVSVCRRAYGGAWMKKKTKMIKQYLAQILYTQQAYRTRRLIDRIKTEHFERNKKKKTNELSQNKFNILAA